MWRNMHNLPCNRSKSYENKTFEFSPFSNQLNRNCEIEVITFSVVWLSTIIVRLEFRALRVGFFFPLYSLKPFDSHKANELRIAIWLSCLEKRIQWLKHTKAMGVFISYLSHSRFHSARLQQALFCTAYTAHFYRLKGESTFCLIFIIWNGCVRVWVFWNSQLLVLF